MTIDIKTAPKALVEALRHRGHSDLDIARMNGKKAFDEYCYWHGLIGYGNDLWDLVLARQRQNKLK